MAVIPPHLPLIDKQDCYDSWKKRGRLTVPRARGDLVDVKILKIEDRGGHLLITGRTHNGAPEKTFRVVFDDGDCPRPALRWRDGRGNWIVDEDV